jgi:PKD repeat protein
LNWHTFCLNMIKILTAMKKFGLLITGIAIILTSCEMHPHADFEPSKVVVETYEEINFYNYSKNAREFDWDFGDGYFSTIDEPSHYYTRPGLYTVKLSAYNGDLLDEAYIDIEVVNPSATLDVQVLEYYQKYPVRNASIILYPTYADWLDQTNGLVEVFTDANGVAIINGLAPGRYYMDIWEKNHNNYDLANDDINNIKTPYLEIGQITQITAYVDYIPSSSALKSRPANRQTNTTSSTKRTCIPIERK